MKKSISDVQQQVMPGYTGQAFSYGNTKLPRNVLIVNLTSATKCPSKALGLCKVSNFCYAFSAERWPNTKNKNLTVEGWLQKASEQDIIKLLEAYIDGSPVTIEYLRLNEAGDFSSQEVIELWDRITGGYLYSTRGIRTYTYTTRADLDFSGVKYIVVNGSLPNIKGAAREFRCTPHDVFDSLVPAKGEYKCPGKCDKCHVCFNDKFKGIIYCRKH